MSTEITIPLTPDSELWRALATEGTTVRVTRDGKVYRLVAEEEAERVPSAAYDPAKVRAALRKTAGSWSDLDGDQMIADIYRWREEGSRPADRP